MNLCIYFQEHALFLKQSGEFEILSWFISYKLLLSCKGPKMRIFYHKFAENIVIQTVHIDLGSWTLDASL